MKDTRGSLLALTSLNHISIVCRSVETSLDFYQNVLGFIPIRRPESLKFEGAWLFNYGIGIHLLQSEDPEGMPKKSEINPKDNHISFQASYPSNWRWVCVSHHVREVKPINLGALANLIKRT